MVNRLFLNLFMNQSLIHLNSEWDVYIEWITLELPITRTHRYSTVRESLLHLSINLGALSSEPVLNSAKVRIYSVFRKWKVPGQTGPPCCSEWKLQLHWTKITELDYVCVCWCPSWLVLRKKLNNHILVSRKVNGSGHHTVVKTPRIPSRYRLLGEESLTKQRRVYSKDKQIFEVTYA